MTNFKGLQRFIEGNLNKAWEFEIAGLLQEHRLTLAVAESCTGGLLAHRLTNIPGSSSYFRAGVVAYSNDAKVSLLGVATETLRHYGAVSAACAREMASGIRKAVGSDIGLATTGIAGPTGATAWKPVGIVYVAYADAETTIALPLMFDTSREIHKERATEAVLTLLYCQIQQEIPF